MGILDYKVSSFTDKFSSKSKWILPLLIILLIISNIFMSIAWYNHLKHPNRTFLHILALSMGFVVLEYIFNIHANSLGHKKYSIYQLKTIQEVITLTIFIGYAFFAFKEKLTWKYAVGFGLIIAGAMVAFL